MTCSFQILIYLLVFEEPAAKPSCPATCLRLESLENIWTELGATQSQEGKKIAGIQKTETTVLQLTV